MRFPRARRLGGPALALAAVLIGCSGEKSIQVSVPTGTLGAPGNTVAALSGFGPDTSRAMNQLGRVLEGPLFGGALRQADLEFRETEGVLWLDLPGIQVGWKSLGESEVFRAHWAALDLDDRSEAFYLDLQILLDRAKDIAGDRSDPMRVALDAAADRLIKILGLQDFDSLLVKPSLDSDGESSFLRLEGSVRAPRGSGGLPGLVARPFGPSPIAADAFADAPLRFDLQFSTRVMERGLRQLESGDDDVEGLLGGVLANTRAVRIARFLVRRFDGRASCVVTGDGVFLAAFSLEDGHDVERVLDRNLGNRVDGQWQAFAGLRFHVDGDRLILGAVAKDLEIPVGTDAPARGFWLRADPVQLAATALGEDDETVRTLSLLGGAFELELGARDERGQLPIRVRLP